MGSISTEEIWLVISLVMAFIYYSSMFIYLDKLLFLKAKLSKSIVVILVGVTGDLFTYATLERGISLQAGYILLFCALIVLFRLLLKGSFLQHCFITSQIIFHLLIMKGISVGVAAVVTNEAIYTINDTPLMDRMASVIAYLFVFIFWIIFSYIFNPEEVRRLTDSKDPLNKLNIFQCTLIIFLLVGADAFQIETQTHTHWLTGYYIVTCLLAVVAFYIVFFLSIKAFLAKEYEIGYKVYEEQFFKQVESYTVQMKYIENMRKFRHDYKKLHTMLYQLIEKGDTEKVKNILLEMDETIEQIERPYKEFSNNVLIQAILTRANTLCEQMDTSFDGEVIMPDNIGLTDVELSRVMTNIIDNAIEASEKIPNNRFIEVKSSVKGNWCTLVCSNRFSGEISTIDGRIVTQKEDVLAHGFGISNIKEIVKSKKGIVNIDVNDESKVFSISVHLPIYKMAVS